MVAQQCTGNIKLTKKERESGMDDRCHKYSEDICEDCGNILCHHHMPRDKHPCDDSVPGCHSIWKHKSNDASKQEGVKE